MDGDGRRSRIIELLKQSAKPIAGKELAKKMGVSRQVIVQDIALLRAINKNILATNKGYMIYGAEGITATIKKTIKVMHKTEEIQDELYSIVDFGGKVLDVVVEHEIYGQIMVDLIITNRQDVDEFIQKVTEHGTRPLKALTDGVHFHTIEARDQKTLSKIEQKLKEKGYLRD